MPEPPCRRCRRPRSALRLCGGLCPRCYGEPLPPSVCRHCGRERSALRARRGLCRACHSNPAVRFRYPHRGPFLLSLGTESPRGRDYAGPAPAPASRPGLEPNSAKVPELAGRARLGLELFPPPEPALPLRELALPYAASRPAGRRLWAALIACDPSIAEELRPGGEE